MNVTLKKFVSVAILFACVSFTATTPAVASPGSDPYCIPHGGVEGNACHISLTELISNKKRFSNEFVVVIGYLVASARGDLLFISKDFADISDTASAVSVSSGKIMESSGVAIADFSGQYVRVVGRFDSSTVWISDTNRVGGAIIDLVSIRPMKVPWGLTPHPY